jgi:signal transduction histidine kinase
MEIIQMSMWNTLKFRLIVSLLMISLFPLFYTISHIYKTELKNIDQEIRERIKVIADSKKENISDYIETKKKNVNFASNNEYVINFSKRMIESYQKINQNSFFDSKDYKDIYDGSKSFFKTFKEEFGFKDIFISDKNGLIVFNFSEGEDLGLNLSLQNPDDSPIIELFSILNKKKETSNSSYMFYPSFNGPAMFIGAPIFYKEDFLGYIYFQLENNKFYDVVNNYQGLGKTGETMLVKIDGGNVLVISPLRSDKNAEFRLIFRTGTEEFKAAQLSVEKKNGIDFFTDQRQIKVIASYDFIENLKWGIVVKIDYDEAFGLLEEMKNQIQLIMFIIALLVIIFAFITAQSISKPISLVTKAAIDVSKGHFDFYLPKMKTTSEVGILVDQFKKMASALLESKKSLEIYTKNLESTVLERTKEISRNVRDIEILFANIPVGIMTIGSNEIVGKNFSLMTKKILEKDIIANEKFKSLLLDGSSLTGDAKDQVLAILNATLGEDVIFWDVNSSGLTNEIDIYTKNGKKNLVLSWSYILSDRDEVESILLCIQDETEIKKLRSQTEEKSRQLAMISQIIQIEEDTYIKFMSALKLQILDLKKSINVSLNEEKTFIFIKRILHTIKGNSRAYGFTQISDITHAVESNIMDYRKGDIAHLWIEKNLSENFSKIEEVIQLYIDAGNIIGRNIEKTKNKNGMHQIDIKYINNIIENIKSGRIEKATSELFSIGKLSLKDLIFEIVESAKIMCLKLEKAEPKFLFQNSEKVFEDKHKLLLISIFNHLVTNAIDHSIEKTSIRLASGKNINSSLIFDYFIENNNQFVISFHDDGAGLAIGKIYKKSIDSGLIRKDEIISVENVANIIFSNGFSTTDKISELSGRGVGLDAVVGLLSDVGGSIKIDLDPIQARSCDIKNENSYVSFKFILNIPFNSKE